MKQLIEFIVLSLVDNPKSVVIEEQKNEGVINYQLKVDSADIGKLIGKEGRIIRAIRTLARTLAIKEGKKVQVNIEQQTS